MKRFSFPLFYISLQSRGVRIHVDQPVRRHSLWKMLNEMKLHCPAAESLMATLNIKDMNKDWVDKAVRYWLTFGVFGILHHSLSRRINRHLRSRGTISSFQWQTKLVSRSSGTCEQNHDGEHSETLQLIISLGVRWWRWWSFIKSAFVLKICCLPAKQDMRRPRNRNVRSELSVGNFKLLTVTA